jgi:hypothetical protein
MPKLSAEERSSLPCLSSNALQARKITPKDTPGNRRLSKPPVSRDSLFFVFFSSLPMDRVQRDRRHSLAVAASQARHSASNCRQHIGMLGAAQRPRPPWPMAVCQMSVSAFTHARPQLANGRNLVVEHPILEGARITNGRVQSPNRAFFGFHACAQTNAYFALIHCEDLWKSQLRRG